MPKKVLVTGGSGLVGQAIRACVEQDSEYDEWVFLSSADADLRCLEECQKVFDKHQPTHVIHLAAIVGGLFHNMAEGAEFFDGNMRMALNVYKSAHQHGVKKLISCLSTCIFPDNICRTGQPIDETMLHLGPPHPSNEGYAYAKRMLDVLNKTYASQYGCKYTSVIPTNIYGPYDNFHLEHAHVIPALIHKASISEKLVVAGSGTPLRQFIYSEDLAKLIVWSLHQYDSTEPIILSVPTDHEVSIGQVAKLIADEFGIDIEFDKEKPDGQHRKTANNSKIMSLIPDFEFTPIQEGIAKTVRWFKDNQHNVRK
jgi:GDP-L-fucose synthase